MYDAKIGYDPDKDYKTEMTKAFEAGDKALVKELESQRQNKIAAANGELDKYKDDTQPYVSWANQDGSSGGGSKSPSPRDTTIQSYLDAKKKVQEAAYRNAYEQALAKYNQEADATKKQATSMRNDASVQSQLANQRLATYLANNGLINSGTNAQMQMNSAGRLQNNLGQITSNEQQALDNINLQKALEYQNYVNNLAMAQGNLDAEALQMQLNQQNALEQLKAQQDYQTQMALMQRQWNLEDAANNSIAWTDPYTGMTYQIDPNTAAQLGYNMYNANMNRAIKVGGGSNNNGGGVPGPEYEITDSGYRTIQKEYNDKVAAGKFNGTYEDYLYFNYPGYISKDYIPTLPGYELIDEAHSAEQKNATKQLVDGIYKGEITNKKLTDPVYAEAIKKTTGKDTIYYGMLGLTYK